MRGRMCEREEGMAAEKKFTQNDDLCEHLSPQKTQKYCSPDNIVAQVLFSVVYSIGTQQWISWADMISLQICLICRAQIQQARR